MCIFPEYLLRILYFFKLPNASWHISWMPYCVVMTYLWMPIMFFVHIYEYLMLPCAYLWIPIVALCTFINGLLLSYIYSRMPIALTWHFLYGLLCAMIHISFKSSFPSQLIRVFLTQDELVRKVKRFYPSKGFHNNRHFWTSGPWFIAVDLSL